jgi:hypothetical protein
VEPPIFAQTLTVSLEVGDPFVTAMPATQFGGCAPSSVLPVMVKFAV